MYYLIQMLIAFLILCGIVLFFQQTLKVNNGEGLLLSALAIALLFVVSSQAGTFRYGSSTSKGFGCVLQSGASVFVRIGTIWDCLCAGTEILSGLRFVCQSVRSCASKFVRELLVCMLYLRDSVWEKPGKSELYER